jgi:hypothetical protein
VILQDVQGETAHEGLLDALAAVIDDLSALTKSCFYLVDPGAVSGQRAALSSGWMTAPSG